MVIVVIGVAILILILTGTASGQNFLGGIMGKLSASQIAQYASNAGFQGEDLITAVAIALAESSGDPNIVGDLNITKGGSIGLWQINIRWHPEFTADQLKDPQQNANAAYSIYEAAGESFTPWSTYKTGAYLAKMPDATQGVNA